MRGGHNAKPAEQRIAEGNPGKRKIPKVPGIGEVIAAGAEPDPPGNFDEAAAYVWRTILPQLTKIGLVRTGDLTAFEELCESTAMCHHAAEEVRNYRANHNGSMMIEGARGQQAHPMIAVARAERQTMLRYFERFGLDPQSRTRLGGVGAQGETENEPEDDLPELGALIPMPPAS